MEDNKDFRYNLPRMMKTPSFSPSDRNLITKQKRMGRKIYFLNKNYDFEEILSTKDGILYTQKKKEGGTTTRKRKSFWFEEETPQKSSSVSKRYYKNNNPFGTIYFLKEDELSQFSVLLNKIKQTIEKHKKAIDLLIELLESTVHHKLDQK